ncbi:MAG: SAM-dependent chlorinase/fluorinase [Desulfobulbaceae bacterium]|jgi:S-adenosylmethionine hydrolase|nr:SAM-dependent chlorinase/fluorinase [Desulfobulbaceae bacterium]
MTPPIFALLTDFGLEDEYVGLIKAALLARLPEARIFDLCHAVPPQDIAEGAFILARALPHLPPACFVIVVVDPGVGGTRRLLAAQLAGRWYLAPDNGLLTPVLRQHPEQIIVLHPPDQLLSKASTTFHGRDLLAPMAASLATRLAAGGSTADLGEAVPAESCCFLPDSSLMKEHASIQGEIIHIDHFGNLASNIRRDDLPATAPMAACVVTIGGLEITGISRAYNEKPPGQPLALWDSGNVLEIAVNGGSAAKVLGAAKNMAVKVHWLAG